MYLTKKNHYEQPEITVESFDLDDLIATEVGTEDLLSRDAVIDFTTQEQFIKI